MDILYEIRNQIAFITLNRPAALNALSYAMVLELHAKLRAYADDSHIRAVLIKGAGEKAFCAGGDIRELYQSATSGGALHREFFAAEYRLDHFLHRYPKPCLALMNGITMGGGMGIAQGSRSRVATERTRMAMPEVAIGLFPDVGASFFLSRLPGAVGVYLALTGSQMDAGDALYAGLADFFVATARLDELERALQTISWSSDSHADITQAIGRCAADELPDSKLAQLRPAIDAHFAHADVQALLHSLAGERRPEYVEWARQTHELISSRCPTLLVVSLCELQRGRALSLDDCFRMELTMMQHTVERSDFREGVRALLVDKDRAPRWQPGNLKDVTRASVDAFFEERWQADEHPLAELQ